jgi:hypothetical protein
MSIQNVLVASVDSHRNRSAAPAIAQHARYDHFNNPRRSFPGNRMSLKKLVRRRFWILHRSAAQILQRKVARPLM